MIGLTTLGIAAGFLLDFRAPDKNLLLSCYLRAANLNADGTERKGETLWTGPERHLVVQLPFPNKNEVSTGERVIVDDPTTILKGNSIGRVEAASPVIKLTAFADAGYRYLLIVDLSDLEKATKINVLGGLPGKPVGYAFTGHCKPSVVDHSGSEFISARNEASTREVK